MRIIDLEMEYACARIHAALVDLGWPVPEGSELCPVTPDRATWRLVFRDHDTGEITATVPGFWETSDTFEDLFARVWVAADLLDHVAVGVKK